jgi:hypothetical protein
MPQRPSENTVSLASVKLTFTLPDDFGTGWAYSHLFNHRRETENFAHQALWRIEGLDETNLYVGTSCSASFIVESMSEASAIEARLQALVEAFPARVQRQTCARGMHYAETIVSEWVDDEDDPVVDNVPLALYLVKFVPLGNEHPAVDGRGIEELERSFHYAGTVNEAMARILPGVRQEGRAARP